MVDVIINHDCNTSRGLIPYGLFTSWKFKFAFDLRLRDLQLHMLQFLYVGFGLYSEKRIDNHSKGGAVVRALAFHQCGAGLTPGVDAICGLCLFLVLSFAPRGFSPGTPVFPSPQKPTFSNSNSTRNQVDEDPLCGCATCKSLFIYLFTTIFA